MTRIELGGKGLPIPSEALPVGLAPEGSLAPITLTFNEAGEFDRTVWQSFGYTIFTAMVVGGAGGRGAFAWYILGSGWYAPTMITTCGGAGGGGGMHIVSGLLTELPTDVIEIIVGQAGANADDAWPAYSAYPVSYNDHGLDPGDPGGDGGYSAFGDVAMASGGQGGEVSPVVISDEWITSWVPGGKGGDGGIGGQITPGGGGAGGEAVDTGETQIYGVGNVTKIFDCSPGEQGFWDGIIGEGGGGGLGDTGGGFGVGQDAAWITEPPTEGQWIGSVHDTGGLTDGGRGSFNYADSSKHGARGSKGSHVISSSTPPTDFNPYAVYSYSMELPSCGGGARPTPLAKYGSYAEGYSPNGVVIVKVQ